MAGNEELTGRELDREMCLATGWINDGLFWTDPLSGFRFSEPGRWHDNLGLVMRLLLAAKGIRIDIGTDTIEVSQVFPEDGRSMAHGVVLLASGPIADAASAMCRGYLKLTSSSFKERNIPHGQ